MLRIDLRVFEPPMSTWLLGIEAALIPGRSREFHHVWGHFGLRVMKLDTRDLPAKGENPSVCWGSRSGARGTRTPDLLGAIQALSQLSYSPEGLEV
jgi:hypothetical protein